MTSYTLEPVNYNPFAEQPATRKPMGFGESFAVGAGQGVSGNLSDELIAGLGAGFAGTGLNITNALGITDVDSPYKQSYENILNRQREGIEQASQDNPIAYTGGAITGAIGGVGKLAAPLSATKVGSKIAGATLPTAAGRLAAGTAKVAAPAAASGYVAGFGAGEGGLDKRTARAEEDAMLSAALGVAAKPVLGLVARGIDAAKMTKKRLFNEVKNLDSDDISQLASQAYRKADEFGGAVSPKLTDNFISKVKQFAEQTPEGKIVAGATPVTNLASRLDELQGKPLSLRAVQEIDEAIGDMVDSEYTIKGITKQGKKLLESQRSLRDIIEDAPDNLFQASNKEGFQALKEGRALYSRMMAMRDIERIIERANRFEQPATAIKTGFRTLASNPKNLRGFKPAERELIKKAAETGVVSDALKTFGSRLLPITTFAATQNPAAAIAAKVGGDMSRSASGALQARRAGDVARAISMDVQGVALPKTNIPSQSIPIGAAVGAQPSQQEQPTPQFNLEPVDFNPFEQGTDDAYSAPRQPLELDITPQSNTFTDEMPLGAGASMTQQNEGFRPVVYTDTAGKRTIGIGFNLDDKSAPRVWKQSGLARYKNMQKVKRGEESITPQEAQALYRTSINIAAQDVMDYYPDYERLSQGQQAALLDMSYHMGGNSLKDFKGLKKALKTGNKNAIMREIFNSDYYRQADKLKTTERVKENLRLLTQF